MRANLLAFATCVALIAPLSAAEFSLEKTGEGVTVNLDGKLFTKYVIKSGNKPILYPIIGPNGKPITRSYPMERVKGEKFDHPHHRSLWFTHGDVNGVDYWTEVGKKGSTVHREFRQVESTGNKAVISAVVDWIDPDGKKVLEDERTYTLRTDGEDRVIDFDITLKATEGPVTFGDTKEGTFGMRIPTVMDLNSRKGGEIVTSEGLRDRDAWGKPAAWVDYHGPIDGEMVGIAILNHPSSFNFPTRWHVRDYGLFAANPFGVKDFPQTPGTGGQHVLPQGDSLALRYRVLLHKGNEQEARVAERFAQFGKE